MVPFEGWKETESLRLDRVVGIQNIEADLRHQLGKLGNPLIGCIRRGLWTQELEASVFELKQNALLASIADHYKISTPVGLIGIWLYDNTVVRTYGGDLRSWWEWDLLHEWALVQTYSGYTLRPYAYIIQQIGNDLRFHCYSMFSDEEGWKGLSGQIVQSANTDPPARIAKDNQRAYITCKNCPVKRRCDTTDAITPQGKQDWGRSYPFP